MVAACVITASAVAADITGSWKWSQQGRNGAQDYTAKFALKDGKLTGETLTFVPGLTATMQACFESNRLFAEAGVPWAHRAERLPCPTLDA